MWLRLSSGGFGVVVLVPAVEVVVLGQVLLLVIAVYAVRAVSVGAGIVCGQGCDCGVVPVVAVLVRDVGAFVVAVVDGSWY